MPNRIRTGLLVCVAACALSTAACAVMVVYAMAARDRVEREFRQEMNEMHKELGAVYRELQKRPEIVLVPDEGSLEIHGDD